MNSQALVIWNGDKEKRSLISRYSANRGQEDLKPSVELQHFERQVKTSKDNQLITCDPISFQATWLEAGALGLTWHPKMGHAWPVRYKNQCTLMIGYQGLTHISMQSGSLKSIQPEIVCVNDPVFEQWVDDTGAHIKHIKNRGERGAITHAYCVALFENGGREIEVLGASDLAKIKACSQYDVIWKAWPGEKSKISAIRRGWKHWQRFAGPKVATALEVMDRNDPMDWDDDSPVKPVNASPEYVTISEDQERELHAAVYDYYSQFDEDKADAAATKWMKMLCDRLGVSQLCHIPADRFDESLTLIKTRIEKVEENRKASRNKL